MKWTIGTKLGTLLGAMCLGLVIALGVTWDRLSKTEEVLVGAKDRFLKQSDRIGKVELSVIKTSLEARHVMLTDNEAERKETLARIIKFHASPGTFTQENMRDGQQLYMATGHYVKVSKNEAGITVNGARILGSVKASNGIVHVVDGVMLVPFLLSMGPWVEVLGPPGVRQEVVRRVKEMARLYPTRRK